MLANLGVSCNFAVLKPKMALYCINQLKNTFYDRWIVVSDLHFPVKKPKKALTKQKLIVVAVIVTMISLFRTFFHHCSVTLRKNY